MLNIAPYSELVNLQDARVFWIERWQMEGGELIDGRLIAATTDDIWRRISVFDLPWDPFAFESFAYVQHVSRSEAFRKRLPLPCCKIPDVEVEDPLSREFVSRLDALLQDYLLAQEEP